MSVETPEALPPDVDILKVGTRALVRSNPGSDTPHGYNSVAFSTIGHQASAEDDKVVIVSSAAIAVGMMATSTIDRPNTETEIPELQRLASIGWHNLLTRWQAAIEPSVGGLLLTRQELDQDMTREEALSVIATLLEHGEVPVCNENDSIAHDEISFGDNDILAATLAVCMSRSDKFGRIRLFLLSNVDGVYEDQYDLTSRIPTIEDTRDYRHLIEAKAAQTEKRSTNGGSSLTNGGLKSKFAAADIATAAGIDVWMYDGSDHGHRNRVVNYSHGGTHFPAKPNS